VSAISYQRSASVVECC